MKCIIADAGPIIALCKVEPPGLLEQLFDNCCITESVYNEVISGNDESVDCLKLAVQEKRVTIESSHVIMLELETVLDIGEATSISLAMEKTDCALLIDESKGRHIAKQLNIPVIGLAGLLILAKKKQIINSVIPILLDLRQKGYWLSDKFLQEIATISQENLDL